jgi:hypothetical protein
MEAMFRFIWKWRRRSPVKITERNLMTGKPGHPRLMKMGGSRLRIEGGVGRTAGFFNGA